MSGYSYLTKKQAGIVYAATKRGDVTADKKFIRKMYDLVGIRWMDLDPKERAIVIHAEQAVDHIVNGRLELAQAELDAEARLKALRDFSGSEWVAEPKKRLDLTLTLVNDYVYEGCSYSYYDDGTRHIYTFRDADGNCFVWKAQKVIDCYDEQTKEWTDAEVGDTIVMKATVKEHSEYKGIKQTVITRPKIAAISKAA